MEFLLLNNLDSVAVALEDIAAGSRYDILGQTVQVKADIPAGHKFAIAEVAEGQTVIKYGVPIGVARRAIFVGDHVHVHNLKTGLSDLEEYTYTPPSSEVLANSPQKNKTFDGYRRPTGKVATRNEVWILSTVGCVSRLAEKIAWKANELYGDLCDGVFAFTHPFGCSQTGDDLDQTKHLMAALAQHPNAGGVLILGLGCENNQGKALLAEIPEEQKARIRFFNSQEVGDELDEGMAQVKELVELCADDKREPCPLADLIIGMKCGGSDGFSGLSANPAVGRIANAVASAEGTVLLTETPEMFGAEQILMNRAESEEVFNQTVDLINNFKKYFIDHGQNIYENPSPGNKDGGITTLEEKSMGAIQKGGTAIVKGVLQYGEPVKKKGLNLLQAPGNDAVSSTALTASGAAIILFTTGRGTPLGFPAPTIKISSNSRLAEAKKNWIDFNAGRLFELNDLDKLGEELMDFIIEIASGRVQTKSEINEQREIAVWKNGVTL